MPTRALRGPFSLADADPGRIVDKPGDISRATHGLSTEDAEAPKLLSPGMRVHPASTTGFATIQVLGSVEEIGLVHRNGAPLLLLLCIDRTFNGITRNLRAAENRPPRSLSEATRARRKTKASRPPWEKKKGRERKRRRGRTPRRPIDGLRPIHGRQVSDLATSPGRGLLSRQRAKKGSHRNKSVDISRTTGHLSTAKGDAPVLSPPPRQREPGAAHKVHGIASPLIRNGKMQLSTVGGRAYYDYYGLIKTLRRRQKKTVARGPPRMARRFGRTMRVAQEGARGLRHSGGRGRGHPARGRPPSRPAGACRGLSEEKDQTGAFRRKRSSTSAGSGRLKK